MRTCCGTMAGIPDWLYYSSIVIVMVISFAVLELTRKRAARARPATFELTRWRFVTGFFKSRWTQTIIQALVVFLFGVVIYAGYYGNPLPGENIAPTLTWNIWWVGLIFIILIMGKMWCYACPWDAITNWVTRLSFVKVRKDTLNLGWKWPKGLKNIYLATVLFVFLTWIELGHHVTRSAEATAAIGLVMLALVFIPGLLFEKKSFCRYGCLIGRISGLYAMFSPVEIRKRDGRVCDSCDTADCLKGNENGYPCPTSQFLKTMDNNTYCTMCGECFRTCPHDNVAFNVRPLGADLIHLSKPRKDEAHLALVLFSLTAFHGLTMTPVWKKLVFWIQQTLNISELYAFSIGMAGCLVLPFLVYAAFVWLSKLGADKSISYSKMFITSAYGVIPIALFYHLAHNVEHFFMESQNLYVLVSDPFGYGWDIFGTATAFPDPLMSLETIWYIQVALIFIGHVFGVYISHKHAYGLSDDRKSAIATQIPSICMMILFSVLSLWLVAQPMEMRTAM